MSSGIALFVSVAVILGIAIFLNYRMSLRNKKQTGAYESDVIQFDQAVHRNDLSEIERIGMDLLYNTSVTLTIVNKIEAKATELAQDYPGFELLKNEVMNKKMRWNVLDITARHHSRS